MVKHKLEKKKIYLKYVYRNSSLQGFFFFQLIEFLFEHLKKDFLAMTLARHRPVGVYLKENKEIERENERKIIDNPFTQIY